MIKFLIKRPIAVNMVYLAFLILGLVSIRYFPVSLLPATDIPEISIRVDAPGMSARMVQNNISQNLVNQLRQVKHIQDIQAESQNNQAFIKIRFTPGTRLNLSYIEVNEKVDAAMPYLPREINRPQVFKARLTDIPAFYLALSYSQNKDKTAFSEFVRSVIKPRIEQLPTVAMADISGFRKSEIALIPELYKMKILGITLDDIRRTIEQNNIELSNILLHQKQYEYFVKISNRLASIEDIKKLVIRKNNRYFLLSDIAKIVKRPAKEQGRFYFGNKRAISLAIIKKSDAKMAELKKQISELYQQFQANYPQIKFHLYRNQTTLLDYAISNLQQSLILGIILSILITFLFLRHWKYALLIGITVPISLIISFLFLWIIHISINIVSLSGLILAVGMMIDNAIIVVENIHQQNKNEEQDIITGTNQVIIPLLSSMFTTLAVFLPLIFIGGITRVLFYEQALTIAAGMLASFVVSITFLPLWYKKMHLQKYKNKLQQTSFWHRWYASWHRFTFRHKKNVLLSLLFFVLLGVFFLIDMPKTLMPPVSYHDMIIRVKWHQSIALNENFRRYQEITSIDSSLILEKSLQAGIPQYALRQKRIYSFYESVIYLNFSNDKNLTKYSQKFKNYLKIHYPLATMQIEPAENIFNQVFKDNRPDLQINLYPADLSKELNLKNLDTLISRLSQNISIKLNLPIEQNFELLISPIALSRYKISNQILLARLKTLFGTNQIGELRSFSRQIPIRLAQKQTSLYQIINNTFIQNKNAESVPLKALVKLRHIKQLKSIISGMQGEYLPLKITLQQEKLPLFKQKIKSVISSFPQFRYTLSGKFTDGNKILNTALMLFLLSFILLYIILAATFDSAILPLVILIELPIDLSGIFVALWLGGEGLNMMSAIGIIVTAGIVINDSILKIDTINQLIKKGMELETAIAEGGRLRVNAILMTSATTILALLPMLFQHGLGVELQLPLVLSVVGGLGLGTLVSLYAIPLIYYYLKR